MLIIIKLWYKFSHNRTVIQNQKSIEKNIDSSLGEWLDSDTYKPFLDNYTVVNLNNFIDQDPE